jgi:hypothetical protein
MTLATFNFFNFIPAFGGKGGACASTVRPEPVEGLSFLFSGGRKGKGFDKLSPNGSGFRPLAVPALP